MKQLLLALTIGLTAMGCRDKDEPQADCGCNSPNKDYVEYSNERDKHQMILEYNPLSSKFNMNISYSNIFVMDEICNPNKLPLEIQKLRSSDRKFYVKKVKGYTKTMCIESDYIDNVYNNFVIEEIEIGEELKQ